MLASLRRFFDKPVPPVPEAIRSFHVPEGVRVYAVGDIHGRLALLDKMLEAIAKDAAAKPPAHVVEVFLGDYIDRGMQSREVIDRLSQPPPQGHRRVCLMGNHEETLLRFLLDPMRLREWGNFGGYATLASYGIAMPQQMTPQALTSLRDAFIKRFPAEHLNFLKRLQLTFTLGDYLFVHAGILPTVAIEKQSREQLLWIREPFLSHREYFERYIVHGHSPVAAPEVLKNRANLDVSDAAQNSLCCLVMEGEVRLPMLVTA